MARNPKNPIYYPMLVSEAENQIDTLHADLERWEQFDALSQEEQNILTHPKTSLTLFQVSQKLSLTEQETARISRLVRRSIFTHQPFTAQTVSQTLPHQSSNIQTTILQTLQSIRNNTQEYTLKNISTFDQTSTHASNSHNQSHPSTHSLPLLQALQKFSKLSQQTITSQDLTLRGNPQPVRPTVKNWITVYQQEMGPAPHEAFERSNFLFHNPNALKLPKEERDRVIAILESLDDNKPLNIDPITQTIQWKEGGDTPAPQLRKVEPQQQVPQHIQPLSSSQLSKSNAPTSTPSNHPSRATQNQTTPIAPIQRSTAASPQVNNHPQSGTSQYTPPQQRPKQTQRQEPPRPHSTQKSTDAQDSFPLPRRVHPISPSSIQRAAQTPPSHIKQWKRPQAPKQPNNTAPPGSTMPSSSQFGSEASTPKPPTESFPQRGSQLEAHPKTALSDVPAKTNLSDSKPSAPKKPMGLRISSGRSSWADTSSEAYQIPQKPRQAPTENLRFSSGHEFPQEKENPDPKFSE